MTKKYLSHSAGNPNDLFYVILTQWENEENNCAQLFVIDEDKKNFMARMLFASKESFSKAEFEAQAKTFADTYYLGKKVEILEASKSQEHLVENKFLDYADLIMHNTKDKSLGSRFRLIS